MSITDPVEAVWNDKREVWYLKQGRETFYNTDRTLMTWATQEEAEAAIESVRLSHLTFKEA